MSYRNPTVSQASEDSHGLKDITSEADCKLDVYSIFTLILF